MAILGHDNVGHLWRPVLVLVEEDDPGHVVLVVVENEAQCVLLVERLHIAFTLEDDLRGVSDSLEQCLWRLVGKDRYRGHHQNEDQSEQKRFADHGALLANAVNGDEVVNGIGSEGSPVLEGFDVLHKRRICDVLVELPEVGVTKELRPRLLVAVHVAISQGLHSYLQ